MVPRARLRLRTLRGAAAILVGILVPVLPAACPKIPFEGFGAGGEGASGGGGSGGGGSGVTGFGGGEGGSGGTGGVAGTVGPGGNFGLGGASLFTSSSISGVGGGAGCVSCATGVKQGGSVCPGLSSDAYQALLACACVGTCATPCEDAICVGVPAGVTCGACIVMECADQQANCSVN